MLAILSLVLGWSLASAEVRWVYLPKASPIYASARSEARLLFIASEGEKVAVRQQGGLYSRVSVKRDGKWRHGYILSSDLKARGSGPRGNFGFGGGGIFTHLQHGGKSFETEDQVQYETEDFTSTSFSPFILAQYLKENFWRLILAYRQTDYTSSAITDIPNAVPRDLELQHFMYSGTIQKMWTPLAKPNLYFGLGLEVSRTSEVHLALGGQELPVASEDLPTYFGGHLAVGFQQDIWNGFSFFVEGRGLLYVNQSPIILGAEIAGGLMYWP